MAKLRQETGFQPGVYRGIPFTKERFHRFVEGSNRAIQAGIPIPLLKKHAPINASDTETQAFAAQDAEGAGWITQFFVTPEGNLGWEADNVPDHVVQQVQAGTIKFTSPEFRESYSSEKEGAYTGPIIRHMAFTPLPGNPHQSPVDVIALQELGCFQFSESDYEGPVTQYSELPSLSAKVVLGVKRPKTTQHSEKATRPTESFDDVWGPQEGKHLRSSFLVPNKHGYNKQFTIFAQNEAENHIVGGPSHSSQAPIRKILDKAVAKKHNAYYIAFSSDENGFRKAKRNDNALAKGVFTKVGKHVRHLLDRKDENDEHSTRYISFTADPSEQSRVRLYKTLTKKAAQHHPYVGYTLGSLKNNSGAIKYALVHKDHVAEFEQSIRDNHRHLGSIRSIVKHDNEGNSTRYLTRYLGMPKAPNPYSKKPMKEQKSLDLQYSELSTRPNPGDYEKHWSGSPSDSMRSLFKSGNDQIQVYAGSRRLHQRMPINKLGFYLDFRSENNGYTQPTDANSKHALHTMDNVSHRIRTLIDKHKPTHLNFSASDYEPTRVEHYKSLARRVSKYHPEYVSFVYPTVGDHEFYIVHKDHLQDHLNPPDQRPYHKSMVNGAHARYENGVKSLHNGMEEYEEKMKTKKRLRAQERVVRQSLSGGGHISAPVMSRFNQEHPDL